ncbi:MAG: hypothetical protein HY665_04075 [Chloroflexi bacterium]|nr:hypothetical protein [Chloroflexota bacterium]
MSVTLSEAQAIVDTLLRQGKPVGDVVEAIENLPFNNGDLDKMRSYISDHAPKDASPTGDTTLAGVLSLYQKYYHLPQTDHLELILGTVAANRGDGDPVWFINVAPPGYGKTEPMNALVGLPDIYPVSVLTEASLLSGTPHKDRGKGCKGGLLAEMGAFGILLIKDFSGMLSLAKDTRGPIMSAMRDVYDGHWTRYVGTEGGRKLEWQGKCGLIGAATPNIDQHSAVMANLGERFCFYRIPAGDEKERSKKALANAGHESRIREELHRATKGLFETITISDRQLELTADEEEKLIALATFATRCRSAVERDSYSTREVQLIGGAESPTRLVKVLRLLMRGLEDIGATRERAWWLIEQVALDSMPALRQAVLCHMLTGQNDEKWATNDLATNLGYPTQTTRRALEDLACYGIVSRTSQGEGKADIWTLTDWTLETTATFPEIRKGYMSLYKTPKLNRQYFGKGLPGGQLSDCPACGRCEWSFVSDRDVKCPCGHEMTIVGGA